MGGASKLLMLLSTPFPLRPLRLSRHPFRFRPAASPAPRFRPGYPAARAQLHSQTNPSLPSPPPQPISGPTTTSSSRPRPEWSSLLNRIASAARFNLPLGDADADFAVEDLTEEFLSEAKACLAFARDRPDLIRLISKKNIEALVENGSAFLFKNGGNSERRLRLFLSGGDRGNVFEYEKAQTVDIMRYVLSYKYSSLSTSDDKLKGGELVEASIRSLLAELISVSGNVREEKLMDAVPGQAPISHDQFSRPPRQNIEMKRGDWICAKCSFMNFARNMRCLECDEVRPKRQLTGAEWECPQCDFFNYGRNMSCLRCDCKRPEEAPSSTGHNRSSRVDQILSGSNIDKSELARRLATNDEKAERWFSKVSQLGDSSDISSAAADEDFPEIMPLRKGVNRFVVSNRKTPLERRLANSQSGMASGIGSNKLSESSISKSLDRILGRTSTTAPGDGNTGGTKEFSSSDYRQSIAKGDPNYVPFVPFPPDMFSKPQNSSNEVQRKEDPVPDAATGELSNSITLSRESLTDGKKKVESSDASDEGFKKAAELDYAADLANAKPEDDFPEIMPMRKGENRFVVSKKKDRSLTSPQYKRRLAMEQANSSDFVPFVPFPPDYFAKKDKQSEGAHVHNKETTAETSAPPEKFQGMAEKGEENVFGAPNLGSTTNTSSHSEKKTYNNDYSMQSYGNSMNESWSNGVSKMSSASNGPSTTGVSAQQVENPQNAKENWNKGFPGKSLEGSAVKETDPLDMSEEAKAERWFRRVAQIKDISELSQIPDEDFPSIMPMRKGVNRFVVSKRKTPLERRLTSPQYRRNLPIVSSDPEKDGN